MSRTPKKDITVSRSVKRPGYAYLLVGGRILEGCEAVDIAHCGTAMNLRFAEDGKYAVRRQRGCYVISVPAAIVRYVPFGRSVAVWRQHDEHSIALDLKDLWRNRI